MTIRTVEHLTWRAARKRLAEVPALDPLAVPLASAVGAMLAGPIVAATDLPVRDAAAEHGWAVAGIGPWTVLPEEELLRLGGLPDGHATEVEIGGQLPPGCSAVVPRDRGVIDLSLRRVRLQIGNADGTPSGSPGQIRYGSGIVPRAKEATEGQVLLKAGAIVTPATVGLAAAAGRDDLFVIPPPSVALILPKLGLARRGPARPGRQRDVVADLLPPWIEAGPARLLPPLDVADEPAPLRDAIDDSTADVIIVAGGIEPGVPERVRSTAESLAAEVLVPGLRTSPGAGTAVYRLAGDRFLITLPGRPAAAAAGLSVVLDPLLSALAGHEAPAATPEAMLAGPAPASWDAQLIPAMAHRTELTLRAHPRPWSGAGGMAALAAADGLVVIEPGLHQEGRLVPFIPLPGVLIG